MDTGVRLLDVPEVAAVAPQCPAEWARVPEGLVSPAHVVPLAEVLAGVALGCTDGRWWLALDEELSGLVAERERDGGRTVEEHLAEPPLGAADVEAEDERVWSWAARPGDATGRTAAAALSALAAAHRSHVAHHERVLAGLDEAAGELAGVLPEGFRRRGTLFVREAAPGLWQSVRLTPDAVELGLVLPAVEAFLAAPEQGLAAPRPPVWPVPAEGTFRHEVRCAPADAARVAAREVLPLLADPGAAAWRCSRPEIVHLVRLVADGRLDAAQRAAAEVHAAVRPQVRPFVLRVVAGLGLEPPPLGSRPDRTPADDAFLAAWTAGAPDRVARLRALTAGTGTRLPASPGLRADRILTAWLRQHADPGLAEDVATWIAQALPDPEWTLCGDGSLGFTGGRWGHGFPAVDRVRAELAAGRLDAGRTRRDWRRLVREAQSGSGRAS